MATPQEVSFDSKNIFIGPKKNKLAVGMGSLTQTMKIPEPFVLQGLGNGETLMQVAKRFTAENPDLWTMRDLTAKPEPPAPTTPPVVQAIKTLTPAEIAALPPAEMMAYFQAQTAYYQAENDRLKEQAISHATLTVRVSKGGFISVYGLGKFPVTLAREQWEKLFATAMVQVKNIILADDIFLKETGTRKMYTGKYLDENKVEQSYSTVLKLKSDPK